MIEPPRLFPTFRCADAGSMRDWLVAVVGFTQRVAHEVDGQLVHVELAFGSAMVMLGQDRDDAHRQRVGDLSARRTDALYVAVEDAEAAFARIAASGVVVVQAPCDTPYGSREFSVRDPEGNLWSFGTYWPKIDP